MFKFKYANDVYAKAANAVSSAESDARYWQIKIDRSTSLLADLQGENGEKIWRYHTEVADSSVVVLNEGESHATRSVPYWDGVGYFLPNDFSTPYDVREHLGDLEFFCELAYSETPVDDRHVFIAGYDDTLGIPTHLTGPLYLRCDNGNPGKIFKDIEFNTPEHIIRNGGNYTTFDNLCIK